MRIENRKENCAFIKIPLDRDGNSTRLRLFLAAPELLDACEAIIEWAHSSEVEIDPIVMEKIRTAIEKAFPEGYVCGNCRMADA